MAKMMTLPPIPGVRDLQTLMAFIMNKEEYDARLEAMVTLQEEIHTLTAGAWSTSAIDALEVGGIEANAVATRLQDVHVYVEYTDAVASSSGSLLLMGVGR